MYRYDKANKQILSTMCFNCSDPYFKPQNHQLFNVGCCSYSPVFTLFEMHAMTKAGKEEFFFDQIYHNKRNTIGRFSIVIHAHLHPSFNQPEIRSDIEHAVLTQIEKEDLKQDYSICQFFVSGKGCGLPPSFKTSVCRGFVCTTVEEQLNNIEREKLDQHVRTIYREAREFNEQHQAALEESDRNLIQSPYEVIDYMQRIT